MGLDHQKQTGRFIDLPTLDAHHPVLDHVEATDAMGSSQTVGFSDQGDRIQTLAVDAHRITSFECDLDLLCC